MRALITGINGMDGSHLADLLLTKGVLAAQKYLVEEVQKVYTSQGVKINNKHFDKGYVKIISWIKLICLNLPCPYCAEHASMLLNKYSLY